MGKYLKLHEKLSDPDYKGFRFLCHHIDFNKGLPNLVRPGLPNIGYWALGLDRDEICNMEYWYRGRGIYDFYYSPLRQNIVLLLAAMNEEL